MHPYEHPIDNGIATFLFLLKELYDIILSEVTAVDNEILEEVIIQRLNERIDRILPYISLVAWLAAGVIFLSNIHNRFAIVNILLGILFFTLFLLKKHMTGSMKIITMIIVPIVAAVFFFTDGGFSSGGIILILMSNSVASLVLSKRHSIYIGIFSIAVLLGLWLWTDLSGFVESEIEMNTIWMMQLLLIFLFIFVFRVVFYGLQEDLIATIKKMQERTYYDAVTGIPNYMYITEQLSKRQEKGEGYVVVMLSLKNLNMFNAIYGYVVGNTILLHIAKQIQSLIDEEEMVARVGGNEFAVCIYEEEGISLKKRLQDLYTKLTVEFTLVQYRNQLEFIMTYAQKPEEPISLNMLYQRAALAMTYAKYKQEEGVVAYDDAFEKWLKRNNHLKNLLKQSEPNWSGFYLQYQGKVYAPDERVVGVEALARWMAPGYGFVSPLEFITLIEHMNLHTEFGRFVLNAALKDYDRLCLKYNEGERIHLSINISPSYLMDERFVSDVLSAFYRSSIAPGYLYLEITEETVLEDVDRVNNILRPLKEAGIRISLDDFGSGFSSLNYLARIEVNEMKLDKQLIDQIVINPKATILLETLVMLAKEYDMQLVAEGVEEKEQRDVLLKMGCHIIQGYLYHKPESL